MYPLSLDALDFLLSEPAREALDALSRADLRDDAILLRLDELRRRFEPGEAALLLDQARLRRRAASKFAHADWLFFIDEALEQATSRDVALYRAGSFACYRRVADLGCGIGADTLALAEVVPEVVAVEIDPVRARVTELNVRASGFEGRVHVVCADWTKMALDVDAAFVDPARRVKGRRVFGLEEMRPPLSAVLRLQEQVPNVAVKVMPGVARDEVPAEAEVEFISERHNLKEALLRFGDLRTGARWQATVLPGPHRLTDVMLVGEVTVRTPGAYLYEPDGAVLRAGLVRTLASQIGAAQIDPTIAYLTSDVCVATPFARVWRVLRQGHFHLKTLNRWLRELEAGHVVIKKRGSPVDVDSFGKRLKTVRRGRPVTVFLTRVLDAPWMIVGTEVDPTPTQEDLR